MLKEIAGTRAYNILKKRKMETVEDVCQLFPSKYYDFSFINPLNTGRLDKNYAFVCKLVSYELKKQSSLYIVRCTLQDIYTQNELCVSWFGTTEMYNVLKKDYRPGDICFIGGKLKASNKKNLFFMSNPIIFKKYDGESDCHIYTAYEKIRGISESNFERIINDCLEHATIPDKVPRELLHKYNLMSKDEAIREMHKPSSVEGVKKAKYRLNIDDLLYFALQLEEKKRNLPAGSVYGIHSLAITTKIIKNLPFQLTKDQKSAYEELVNRIRSGKRLNALIQGDVGCGKTILAFLLMFVMADNGFQSVLLAPTQVLASQHYNELKEMAAQYNIDVVYIANGLKKKEREAILKSIEDGSALMIVGTHSVLSKEVKFHDLGLSITKEEDFQTFQETTLSSIESRMEEADKKEKELIKKEEAFHVRDSKLKDAEMDIELRYKKLEDKERTAAKKEVELSDKEAAIRRTEIVKKDAENKLKQLEITEKNLTNRKEQLDMKESELQKRQEAFEKKYHQALEELASLDRKQEELKKKEAELRTLIGENEKLEEQLKELKDDTEETRKLLDTKDASIKEKEKVINNQKNTIKSLKETVTQTQQKNKALSEQKKSLQGKLNASDEKKSALEDEIAKVRSDLYDTKEKLKSTKSSADKQNKNVTDNERLIAENEKLKAEMDKNSHSYQQSMKEMNYELDSSQSKITELKSLLKKANMEVEELKKDPILSFDFDPDTIGAKEIVSERQGLYAATIDNCTIYIDTENQVLQFKKAVRRPAKYTKKILSWNEESINETYYITSSEVCCRKTCRHDITEEMQDVIERIRSLK